MSVIDIEKRNLRTLRKFYKLCFHQREYYEQPSLDEEPDKRTKERSFSLEGAAKEVGFWQVEICAQVAFDSI